MTKTGGGEDGAEILTPFEETVVNLIGEVRINGHPHTQETEVYFSDNDKDDVVMSVASVMAETSLRLLLHGGSPSISEKPEDCLSPSAFKDTPLRPGTYLAELQLRNLARGISASTNPRQIYAEISRGVSISSTKL
ncbi:hypothetical protein Zmor_003805 [Zophobas morio]|uniref:Uncharacterized protein n=1 Tax=Zophobas morio TaxID=2755281 RepID=A0AA38HPS8_9CUCU|nr:hypothetical protein Zmor_003805 [Zophobas morio]